MTYRIDLTVQALADLESIHEGIAEHSPQAADRVYDLLQKSFESLADFPNRHPRARESARESTEIRQYVDGRHRILFRVLADSVQILRVRHVAQDDLKPGELN
ncbi:MAG TPA: type II toxin-antitoxin system RelE/ParE family toxin [Phycisphaerae bacterium]|nr:type II toxin-antitoxin system RelE/ParE family toxin [Phycisphaerae bacterium]